MKAKACIFFMVMLFSCIGEDIIDDPLDLEKGNSIQFLNLNENRLPILLNESVAVIASYFDKYGIERSVDIVWEVTEGVAVELSGSTVVAVAPGQATVTATYQSAVAAIQVNVIEDNNDVASVSINQPVSTTIAINKTVQLSAVVKNISNQILQGKTIEWFSENTSIATVSSSGLVTPNALGVVEIHAKSEDVKSNSIAFTVANSVVRTGTFQSAGGYTTTGMVEVEVIDNKVRVTLSPNFSASTAAGTFIYLANSTSGSVVKTNGLELGVYTPSGTKVYETSQATLNQYEYVIVLCKPFGITFGFARLN